MLDRVAFTEKNALMILKMFLSDSIAYICGKRVEGVNELLFGNYLADPVPKALIVECKMFDMQIFA